MNGINLDLPIEVSSLASASAGVLLEAKIAASNGGGEPLVTMKEAPGMHRGLFLTRDVHPGDVLLEERSFCWQMEEGAGERVGLETTVAQFDAQLLQMAPFHLSPPCAIAWGECQHPPPSRRQVLQDVLAANSFGIRDLSAFDESASASEPTANATEYAGRALFSVICLTNHSCAPIARVFQKPGTGDSAGNPPRYILQARESALAGTEVTIAYVPRIWRQARRQDMLLGTWGFSCACPRCSRSYDDTVVLRCAACGEPALHLLVASSWRPTATPSPASHLVASSVSGTGSACDLDVYPTVCSACGHAGTVPRLYDACDINDDDAVIRSLRSTFVTSDSSELEPSFRQARVRALEAAAALLLHHPVLACSDARLWTVLNEFVVVLQWAMQQAAEAAGNGVGGSCPADDTRAAAEATQALYQTVAVATATTSLSASFVNPFDIGVEVELES